MAGPDLQVLATLEHPQEVRLIWAGPWLGMGDPPEAGPRVLYKPHCQELRSHPNLCGLSCLVQSAVGPKISSREGKKAVYLWQLISPSAALCSSPLPSNRGRSSYQPGTFH